MRRYIVCTLLMLVLLSDIVSAGNGPILDSITTTDKNIAIAIEGVDNEAAIEELRYFLKLREIHVTFFIPANFVLEHPITIKNMLNDGHEFGNYGVKKQYWGDLRKEDIIKEYATADRILHRVCVNPIRLCKPPYLQFDSFVIEGIKQAQPAAIIIRGKNVKDNLPDAIKTADWVQNGDIISLCVESWMSVKLAEKLIDEIQLRGYNIYTVSTLIHRG